VGRTLIAVIVALACLALAPGAQARVSRDFVGITSEDVFAGVSSYRTSNLGSQRSIGVGLTRQTFDWRSIETSPGHYNLTYYDAYVASAASHGIKVLPILFNPPGFRAKTLSHGTCPPRKNSTMASFAKVLVRRYGPKGTLWSQRPGLRKVPIRSWQIWNEPNLGVYWCRHANARKYVGMLKTVGRAIKKLDRRAEIVTAGLPPSTLKQAIRLTRFIKQLYKARGAKWFNTLAINSYAKDHKQLASLLRGVRKLMNRRHDRRARIWITELGWGDKGPHHRFIVGANGQARRISKSIKFIRQNRKRLRLRGFVYFSWRDGKRYAPLFKDLWGLHTGLRRLDGTRKPAYTAFKRSVAALH
jgi:polysaccharide biosynthesis protein PslG